MRCHYCLDPITRDPSIPHYELATQDHVIPTSHGGPNVTGNRVWCCGWCNVSKGARRPIQWIKRLESKNFYKKGDKVGPRKRKKVLARKDKLIEFDYAIEVRREMEGWSVERNGREADRLEGKVKR